MYLQQIMTAGIPKAMIVVFCNDMGEYKTGTCLFLL